MQPKFIKCSQKSGEINPVWSKSKLRKNVLGEKLTHSASLPLGYLGNIDLTPGEACKMNLEGCSSISKIKLIKNIMLSSGKFPSFSKKDLDRQLNCVFAACSLTLYTPQKQKNSSFYGDMFFSKETNGLQNSKNWSKT